MTICKKQKPKTTRSYPSNLTLYNFCMYILSFSHNEWIQDSTVFTYTSILSEEQILSFTLFSENCYSFFRTQTLIFSLKTLPSFSLSPLTMQPQIVPYALLNSTKCFEPIWCHFDFRAFWAHWYNIDFHFQRDNAHEHISNSAVSLWLFSIPPTG